MSEPLNPGIDTAGNTPSDSRYEIETSKLETDTTSGVPGSQDSPVDLALSDRTTPIATGSSTPRDPSGATTGLTNLADAGDLADPADPADVADSAHSVDPVDPADAVAVADPADAADPVDVADPADAADPVGPADGTDRTDVGDRADSAEVADPTNLARAESTDGTARVDAVDPADRVDPAIDMEAAAAAANEAHAGDAVKPSGAAESAGSAGRVVPAGSDDGAGSGEPVGTVDSPRNSFSIEEEGKGAEISVGTASVDEPMKIFVDSETSLEVGSAEAGPAVAELLEDMAGPPDGVESVGGVDRVDAGGPATGDGWATEATSISQDGRDAGGRGAPGEELPVQEELDELADPERLRSALEAVLLVVDAPTSSLMLAQVLGRSVPEVDSALRSLRDEFDAGGRGIDLREVADGWRLYSRDEFATYVERFVLDGQQARLTQASLETLAVIAYRQPVTRSRISGIRGVSVDAVMRTLLTRGLVEECGADPDTGGGLYRTTRLFLEKMGLRSLDELPSLAPLLPDTSQLDDVELST